MNKFPENIWWNEISGPNRFLQAIKDGLADGKNVLIVMPNDMPWRKEMRDNLELPDGCVRNDIDVEDMWADAADITEKIRSHIIENNTPIIGYRDDFYLYYKKECRNRGSIFWFKGISAENRNKCVAFLVEYSAHTKGKKLPPIVMEVRENQVDVSKANICVVEWRDYVTSFDSRLFAYMIVTQDLLPLQKKYLAEVCTSLFVWDAELCAYAIDTQSDGILKCEWDEAFKSLNCEYEKRGQDEAHFLYLYRNGAIDEIHKRIWEAQLATFFPIVEERRLYYVKRHFDFLEEALNGGALAIIDNLTKKKITDPYDLEIGQIVYCVENCTSKIGFSELNEMRDMRDVRNALAHLELLDKAKITKIIGLLHNQNK